MLERVLTYVTAWAWTDVFFASAATPSVWTLLTDCLSAIGLSLAVVMWLVFFGSALQAGGALEISEDSTAGIDRSGVESYFMANSASFFVGFAWWKVLRDLAAVSGRVALAGPHAESDAILLDTAVGTEGDLFNFYHLLERVQQAETREFYGSLVGNLIYGPVLSVVIIWAKHVAFARAEEVFK